MLSRMLVAGSRTAIVLNDILAARAAANLHGGTMKAIAPDDEDDRAEKEAVIAASKVEKIFDGKPPISGLAALGTNFGIFTIVFAIFLYVMHVQANKDGSVAQSDKAKRKGIDSGKVV